MTRIRPYKPNGNCRIEQKNWDVLRRCLGYGRKDCVSRINRSMKAIQERVDLRPPLPSH